MTLRFVSVSGDDTIGFDGHCTSAYNKRLPGGDVSPKSWSGFLKIVAVNATGLLTEGVFEEL